MKDIILIDLAPSIYDISEPFEEPDYYYIFGFANESTEDLLIEHFNAEEDISAVGGLHLVKSKMSVIRECTITLWLLIRQLESKGFTVRLMFNPGDEYRNYTIPNARTVDKGEVDAINLLV